MEITDQEKHKDNEVYLIQSTDYSLIKMMNKNYVNSCYYVNGKSSKLLYHDPRPQNITQATLGWLFEGRYPPEWRGGSGPVNLWKYNE